MKYPTPCAHIYPHHMQLFGDIRTHKVGVLRVTRFGLAKMSESAQKVTSFPEDHVTRIRDRVLHEERRWRRRVRAHHLSECNILGQSTRIGTRAFMVVRRLMMDLVMGTIMLDHKFLVCSSTNYARAWAKSSARA